MDRLNEHSIRQHITISDTLTFHLLDSIDSTNRFLKDLPPSSEINICCAETQTHGKGRMGRSWHSPYGENIYFSARIPLYNNSLDNLSGLSLITSLAVIKTLTSLGMGDGLTIKWPNDILWNNKKLSGCLLELIVNTTQSNDIIIGIGINVNSKAIENPLPDKEWCSLSDITGQYKIRNIIIGNLIGHLINYLNRILTLGFKSFSKEWELVDHLKGKQISLKSSSGRLNGLAQGINHLGQLILLDSSGNIHHVSSGDATLKA